FQYDAAARVTGMSYSNGTAVAIGYDGARRPVSLSWTSAAIGTLEQFQYMYDKNGNPLLLTDHAGTHTYRYDALNRLTAATHPTQPAETYSYYGAGNRTRSAADSNYFYDAAGRLLAAEGWTYAYDGNGNLTTRTDASGNTITNTYDAE